jgi:hypothetical protein
MMVEKTEQRIITAIAAAAIIVCFLIKGCDLQGMVP